MSSKGPGCEMKDTSLACTRHVPARLLMCGPHWNQVPVPVRSRVYATCRDLGVLSEEYMHAVEDAVKAVLEANGLQS